MNSVLIYTTRYCPYCVRAKNLLESKGVVYQEIAVDNSISLRQEMMTLSGGYTVPQILIDDKPIGGCDELYALERNGQLDTMLVTKTQA